MDSKKPGDRALASFPEEDIETTEETETTHDEIADEGATREDFVELVRRAKNAP